VARLASITGFIVCVVARFTRLWWERSDEAISVLIRPVDFLY